MTRAALFTAARYAPLALTLALGALWALSHVSPLRTGPLSTPWIAARRGWMVLHAGLGLDGRAARVSHEMVDVNDPGNRIAGALYAYDIGQRRWSLAVHPLRGRFLLIAPIWPFLLGAGLLAAATLWPRRVAAPGHCPACAYDRRGAITGPCPECGTTRRAP